ncbi:aldo/keto reductase [Acidithiobacillus caldus]|uniref:Oxidoreductase n=3 Tax=Acidithiobacillus caldus TaxID=33059 RepID=A0A059ZRH7_ACICK|nr:aldo/keto reductase [Acidithiobacillus caldus]AIA55484.1 Oxidoreductase [Acidithiobacillus caldus ATCC 51756]MBU2730471.1 aldo/keto reductase [Acidithiobacillus caldus]MBU2736288.1 aldo/keto reductase [Acidithiobacillus caldus ATCC 51756]MBU2743776.1 aldo/keto reductase [Acidithiobacillus caldus]MBU2779320.1 aldo/keto reductase [Acidithiobacillus caldus]
MEYRQLGRTGMKVSTLCLGTMTFGSDFYHIATVAQKEADEIVRRAWESGINFFDTADIYSRGESEEILGKALKNIGIERDAAVIATKVRGSMSDVDPNGTGLSRKHIMTACHASLRRLGTDRIDLYQVHGWDCHTPMDETLRALDDLVRSGKVLYAGCSNWPARHIARAQALADAGQWTGFSSLQAYYSLVGRDLEHELLPLCREQGLGVLPWSPLSGGFLTGKYRRDTSAPADGRRKDFDFPPIDQVHGYDAVEAAESIAQKIGATIPQVAIAWLLAQSGISSVIIGAKRMEQLKDNLGAVQVRLTGEDVARLSAITAPAPLYPQWMVSRQNSDE